MRLAQNIKETIRARIQRDPEFGEEMLREGIKHLCAGDITMGKILLQDYIDATIGLPRTSCKPPNFLPNT